jgi:hypothetical protein
MGGVIRLIVPFKGLGFLRICTGIMLPKVAYMDSFSGRNDIITEGSSSPQIIISCPSCSTRFSVDGDAVSAMEHPRFHCSRCDAIFGLAQARQHEHQRTPEPRRPTPQPAETKTRSSYGSTRSSSTSPSIKPSDFSLGGGSSAASSEPQSLARDIPPARQAHVEQHSTPPRGGWELFDSHIPTSVSKEDMQEEMTSPHIEALSHEETPLHNSFEPPAPAWEQISLEANDDLDTQSSRPDRLIDARHSASIFEKLFGSFAPRSQGLIFMTTPLVAACALLVVLSYSSRISPITIGATARSIAPSFLTRSLPKLPPPGVSVKGLKLTYVKTQSKEILPVISGTVTNNTSETIDGITLEGIGFNDRGEVMLSSQAPLRSALSREKVSDLSLETVVKFQNSLSARKASIAPKEEVPFTLALLGRKDTGRTIEDTDLGALKYFSARVFSIK